MSVLWDREREKVEKGKWEWRLNEVGLMPPALEPVAQAGRWTDEDGETFAPKHLSLDKQF